MEIRETFSATSKNMGDTSSKPIGIADGDPTSPADTNQQHCVENFQLVYLDALMRPDQKMWQIILEQLRSVVNDVRLFNESNICVNYLKKVRLEKVFVITSGSLGRQLIPEIHDYEQIDSIYIFCGHKSAHEEWAKTWEKIRGVYTQIGPICDALQSASKQFNYNSIGISFGHSDETTLNTHQNKLDSSFMYTHLFQNILLDMKHDEHYREEFIQYCRVKYDGTNKLAIIDQFGKNYQSNKAIQWYTDDRLIYPMLNRALRLLEADIIVKMAFFIIDLHRSIEELHKTQISQYKGRPFTVYRGQGLSQNDFDKLKKTEGGLISFSNFLSTSKEKRIAEQFAEKMLEKPHMIAMIFIMTIDPTSTSSVFANIEKSSVYKGEREILFSMNTIFRVEQIKTLAKNERFFQVYLSLTHNQDEQLCHLTEHFKRELHSSVGWNRIGLLLIKIGQIDRAEDLYRNLLQQTSEQNEKAQCHHQLGVIKYRQGKCVEAIEHYEQALEIERNIVPMNLLRLAQLSNDMGLVYTNTKDYVKAISFYKKALEIQQKIPLPSDHPAIAITYSNIALLYYTAGDYTKSVSFYQKALTIQLNTLPSNHPSLATTYNNIGATLNILGTSQSALPYLETGLKIRCATLPPNHPDLASSYNNIGSAYYNLKEYSKAMHFFEKLLHMCQHSLPAGHPNIECAVKWIELVKENSVVIE